MSTSISNDFESQLHSPDRAGECGPASLTPSPSRSWFQDRIASATHRQLRSIDHGLIHFDDGFENHSYGSLAFGGLEANLHVADQRFFQKLLSGGSMGFAESYLSGWWSSDDLTALLRILYRNLDKFESVDSGISRIALAAARLMHRWARNTISGSRRNIAAHYDLSDKFFELFLDRSMMYSSAYYQHASMSLEQAAIAKLDQLCRKLNLTAGDRVMEIGSGWGGFAVHAAKKFDVNIDTTTISQNQFQTASERIQAANLGDRVRLLNSDYRELEGQYDKVVSVEMVEAVGEQFLDVYFRKCGELLRPGGRLVLQAIVMPERRYDTYRKSVDFIQKYIFPGGFLPSIAAICESVGRTSTLTLQEIEDLSPHYARTLFDWRHRFLNRLGDVHALGFDDRFVRMWDYYLCYCEAAFHEQAVKVVQVVWDKPAR